MIIRIEDTIRQACACYRCALVSAQVVNTANNDLLWKDINTLSQKIRAEQNIDSIKKDSHIEATRTAYKRLGKDPSRYRPSAEALRRRILQGHELYRISALVDIINLVSLETGYSIGGFDVDKIEGEVLTLGVGRNGEPYEGIGRGMLNIENMPVFRDAIGGIGTPTSDNLRTQITMETRHLLCTINSYDGDERALRKAATLLENMLIRYSKAENVTIQLI